MKNITLEDLKKALEKSWSAETSSDPKNWTPKNPAWGQCAITALIVQDFFGGDLLRAVIEGIGSHYWNRLPDGSEIDLTKIQFLTAVVISPGETRTREYVLSYPDTVKRYKILKEKVEKFLEKGDRNEENIFDLPGEKYYRRRKKDNRRVYKKTRNART